MTGTEPPPRPRVVAVIGASLPGPLGGFEGGFEGSVYAVNPHGAGTEAHGVPCVATLADLPGPPDLAVIAVPAYAVPGVAAACGRVGASALMVTAPDLSADQRRCLLALCRQYGMRLAGADGWPAANPRGAEDNAAGR